VLKLVRDRSLWELTTSEEISIPTRAALRELAVSHAAGD
jgi:hypothetical protein